MTINFYYSFQLEKMLRKHCDFYSSKLVPSDYQHIWTEKDILLVCAVFS
jgi:hypothetical protein